MFKVLLLVSAFVALGAAARVHLTPSDLHVVWETLHQEIRQRHKVADDQLKATNIVLRTFNSNSKTLLNTDIESASKTFWDTLKSLGNTATDKQKTACITPATNALYAYNETIYTNYYQLFDNYTGGAEKVIIDSVKTTTKALEDLQELAGRVQRCSTIECATELEFEIVHAYNRAVTDIDFGLQHANNAALIWLPNQLEEHRLDHIRYLEVSAKLLDDARECIKKN